MTALDQLINLLRHWDKNNRETFCGIRVHEALQELEELLPKDDEDTWYCPKCRTPSSTYDAECGSCGYEREEVMPSLGG
jgi:predicted RNA-binding Zn-ribbon protein involved in translation (DUF1610 family)